MPTNTTKSPCVLHHHDDPDIQQRITVIANKQLQHMSPSPQGDLRCSTINANTLNEDKLHDIIALMTTHGIDIMFITDIFFFFKEALMFTLTRKNIIQV